MFKKIYAPLNMQWEVIPTCNYNCHHCYNHWRRSNEGVINSLWALENGSKVVDEIIQNKVNALTITGGEPLLVFDEIKPYINKLVDNGVKVSINTNAAYLDNGIAHYLGTQNIGILVSLPCCIPEINDRITDTTGSFFATTTGCKTALKHGVRVSINMVVSKINQNHVIETARFVKDTFGLTGFMATKAGKPINATEEYDQYEVGLPDFRKLMEDLLYIRHEFGMTIDSLTAYPECAYVTEESFRLIGAKRKCTAGRTIASIGFDGSVRACTRAQQSYGNLAEDTLIECWDRMSDWRSDDFLPEKCKECDRRDGCAGGCRTEASAISSLMNADDPCMDASNLPVRFKYSKCEISEFSDRDIFLLIEDFQTMNEEFGIRITVNSQSVFITAELFAFIDTHRGRSFTKADLKSYFNIDDSLANQLLTFLNGRGLSTLI